MMTKAVDRAEREGVGPGHRQRLARGLLRRAPTCSALMVALGQNNYEAVAAMVTDFQQACHAHRATPACRWWRRPFGLALGGGTEVVLGCQTCGPRTSCTSGWSRWAWG